MARANHTGTQSASTISDFVSAAAAAAPVSSVSGRVGAVTLDRSDIGLSAVDNTSGLNKPLSLAEQTALAGKFPIPAGTTAQYVGGNGTLATFPAIPTVQAYDGTSQRASTLAVYKSAIVASGVAVFHLTSDGTAAGTALFPNGPNLDSVNLVPNDSAASYQMSWVWSNSNKTLTATVNKSVSTGLITLLGISVLGAPAVANGATIRLQVTGE